MAEISQDSLLREIDEDIRRERYEKLWNRYGKYVIAVLVLLLAGIAGYKLWQERTLARQAEVAQQFTAAIALAAKDTTAAEQQLRKIGEQAPDGYAMLATFQEAALLAKKGDQAAARSAYQNLQRTAPDAIYRDLAVLLEALVALEKEALPIDADAIQAKLQRLSAENNPWRFSARELSAILAWRGGQAAEAKDRMRTLAADPQAPIDIRDRAQQFLAQIG
jgi:hypothetical protein